MVYLQRKNGNDLCNELLIKAAREQGARVECLDQKSKLFILSKDNQKHFIQSHRLDINRSLVVRLISDKALAKNILSQHDINVPRGVVCHNLDCALRVFNGGQLHLPLVVKPVFGSQGKAVTVAIKSKKWLARAVKEALKYNQERTGVRSFNFIVEEFVSGSDYRLLVLDRELISVVRRDPAYVIGDGRRTVAELINIYNQSVKKQQYISHCPIADDYELRRNLEYLGINKNFVVPKGKRIVLRKNANVSTGGRSFACSDRVAKQFKELATRIAHLFRLRFFAIDLITKDISIFGRYAIIELNSHPVFDINEFPYKGKPVPVSKLVIKSLFRSAGK